MWWLWAALGASAGEAEAEAYRLKTELATLAKKNAWSGVERTYVALEAVGLPLSLDDMTLGALAARSEGNMLTAMERLQRGVRDATAVASTPAYVDAQAAVDDLKSRYGFVHIVIYETGKKVTNIERPDMPFGPEDQKAILWAQNRIATSRAFMGLLPMGHYKLGEQTFEVLPITVSAQMLELRVGTPAASGAVSSGP